MSRDKSPDQNQSNQESQQPKGGEQGPIEKTKAQIAAELEIARLEEEKAILLKRLEEAESNKPEVSPEPEIELNENGLMIGNQDSEGQYPFNPSWAGGVVVRQSEVARIGASNDFAEIPSSVRLAVYPKATFDKLKKDGGFGDMQIRIIHQP